ncbi:hypothetical protein [Kitasatospora purpeofusca]|uniref:hypothetical protein n=1 Tax=Kitasatospora purpeofusca TaxID=67352 RepID=UPI002A5AD76C|nr:hypothetical protein [Kitasatospora purpeofusca]MDY0812593.1 hypothetical protein [Kitasatospora purpeofusca]
MNHLRRALRGTARLVTRLRTAVEQLDTRADAALRARLRPLVSRAANLVRRMAAANCGDALTRHLPCRAHDRGRERDRAHTRDRSALED